MKGILSALWLAILLASPIPSLNETPPASDPNSAFNTADYDSCTYSLVNLHCAVGALETGRNPCVAPSNNFLLNSFDSLRGEYSKILRQYDSYMATVDILKKALPEVTESTPKLAENFTRVYNYSKFHLDSIYFTMESFGQDLNFFANLLEKADTIPEKVLSLSHVIARDTYDYMSSQLPNATLRLNHALYYYGKNTDFSIVAKHMTAYILKTDAHKLAYLFPQPSTNTQTPETQITAPEPMAPEIKQEDEVVILTPATPTQPQISNAPSNAITWGFNLYPFIDVLARSTIFKARKSDSDL